MAIDCHFFREKLVDGLVSLSFTPSSAQIADLFTKALSGPLLRNFLSKFGVRSPDSTLKGDIGSIAPAEVLTITEEAGAPVEGEMFIGSMLVIGTEVETLASGRDNVLSPRLCRTVLTKRVGRFDDMGHYHCNGPGQV